MSVALFHLSGLPLCRCRRRFRVSKRLVSTTATGRYNIITPGISASSYIQASLNTNRAIIIFVLMVINISTYLLVIMAQVRGEKKI